MAVESAADLAAFFNPQEFGSEIRYQYDDETPIDLSAQWDKPSATSNFGSTEVVSDVHLFTFPRSAITAPRAGATIAILAAGVPTGEVFEVISEPRCSRDGGVWMLSAGPA